MPKPVLVEMLDRGRRAGIDAPVVLVLYVGNDFADEAIWSGMDADRSYYIDQPRVPLARCLATLLLALLRPFRSAGQVARMEAALQRQSALYRAALIAGAGIGTPARAAERQGAAEQLMIERCDKPPFAGVGKRTPVLTSPSRRDRDPGQSRDSSSTRAAILRALTARKDDPGSERDGRPGASEETCAAVHGHSVERVAPFIDEVRCRRPTGPTTRTRI